MELRELLEDALMRLEEHQWHHVPGTCLSNERYECTECDEWGDTTLMLEHKSTCCLGNLIKRIREKLDND